MRPTSLLIALLLLSAAGCGGDDSSAAGAAASGVTVRDSAGIRIVENHDSVWTEETRWRLAEEPDFVIGSFDGSVPGTDFGDMIRARAWGDGVVVSDIMSVGLHVFDESGAFVEELGRQGDGPTELPNSGELHVLGPDTLVVWNVGKTVVFERGAGAASSYDPGRPPVDAEVYEGFGGRFSWSVRAVFRDGSYVMMNTPDPGSAEAGFETKHLHAERMLPGGQYGGPLGSLAMQRFYTAPDGEFVPASPQTTGHVATQGMHLWHAFADSVFEIRRIDGLTGQVDLLLRASVTPTTVDDALRAVVHEVEERQVEWMLEQLGDQLGSEMRGDMERRMAEMRARQPTGYFAPQIFGLRPTASGHLFVDLPDWDWFIEARQLLASAVPPDARMSFAVFDPDGRWLGTFEGPAGFTVTDVTDEYLVGYRKDEFDVPYVERWKIIRP